MTDTRFFVVALPRSRTAWLANLLTYEGASCLHEPLIGCSSLADLERKLLATGSKVAGAADTGFPLPTTTGTLVERLVERYPDARFVCLLRDAAGFTEQTLRMDVGASAESINQLLTSFREAVDYLHQLGPQTMIVRPRQLDDYDVCQSIWNHIGMETALNRSRFEMLRDLKVEIFMDRMKRKVAAHGTAMLELLGEQ